MASLQLYPFRFRDRLTGGWVRARHRMQVPEMQRHYSEWEITGAPEIRYVTDTSTQHFNPFELAAPLQPFSQQRRTQAVAGRFHT
jgi:hypothetical protein